MTKQKVSTKIALAILLIAALLLACSLCFFTPIAGAETDSAANTATSSVEGDYSEYTDNELPDTISANNILQIIPAELFNNGGPHVYYGENYGFVVYTDTTYNYVLIFNVVADYTDNASVLKLSLNVVYEGAFIYAGANVTEVEATKHIILSD